MALRPEHELHRRRKGRNLGLLAVLLIFIAIVFGLTVVKVTNGDMMEGFDHQPRTSILPRDNSTTAPDAAARPTSSDEAAPAASVQQEVTE